MANKTVYPYGTDGQLPSSIGLVNDLYTGGSDKALSAEMGKNLNEQLNNFQTINLSQYTEVNVYINNTSNKWVVSTGYTGIFIAVSPGDKFVIQANEDKTSNYAILQNNTYANNTTPSFVTGGARVNISAGKYKEITIPEDGHYIYICTHTDVDVTPQSVKKALGNINDIIINDLIIASGTLTGNGTTLVNYDFPISKGDYLHIDFPNGDWQTAEQTDSYAKVIVNLYKINGSTETLARGVTLSKVGWTVPDYGFDFYASPKIVGSYNTGRLRIRAASGTSVPFVIRRLSKESSKPYFADEISDSVTKIKAVQPSSSLTLAMITDLHYRSVEQNGSAGIPFAPYSPLAAIMSIKSVASLVRLDNVVCLGDGIDGRDYAVKANEDASDLSEFFSYVKAPLIYAVGNHDDNRYYNNDGGDRRLNQGEIYANYVQQVDERTELGGAMNGCNYYRDIERHKVRCIVLMSINFSGGYEFTSSTRTWLANTLSSMHEGYKAIVFTHVPPPPAQNWSETSYTGGTQTATILAENADKIICVFDGHLHLDNVYVKPYISVNLCSQKAYNGSQPGNNPGSSAPEGAWWPIREAGTKNELLWDAVVINQEEGLLSCIRVGAGVDRYIHYTPIEVAAGGNTTLSPAVVTATSWAVLASEASAISVAEGVVTVDASATVGSRLMAKAVDASGNFEFWCIKVVAGS